MFLRKINISILPSYCGNTVTHQNQMLTSRGNSLVRTISSSKIAIKVILPDEDTYQQPSAQFCTLHCTAYILYTYIVQDLEGLQHLHYAIALRLPALCNDETLFHYAFSIMSSRTGHRFFGPNPIQDNNIFYRFYKWDQDFFALSFDGFPVRYPP